MTDPQPARDASSSDVVLRNERSAINAAIEDLVARVQTQHPSPEVAFAVRLALEEALSNAYRHGNAEDPTKSITLRYELDARRLVVEIEDEGTGFQPEAVPDPTATENLERPSGRGIMLIRSYMADVRYNERGNCLRMVYEFPEIDGDGA